MNNQSLVSGDTGLRFRAESPAEATAEALQPTDTGGRHVDTVSVEVLRGGQILQQRGDVEDLPEGPRAGRPAVHALGKGKLFALRSF